MTIEFERTESGFVRGTFKDRDGEECSIQESSVATEHMLWLGLDEGTHVDGHCLARMHITKEIAEELVRHLNCFIYTGQLPEEPDE